MTYLISLILLLLPTYLFRFSILGIPTTVLEILIYIVFIFGLWRAYRAGFRKISIQIALPIALLIIALITSTIIAPDRRVALGEFKGFFIDPILVFWLVYQFVKPLEIWKIFLSLSISGVFVSLHTIIQKLLGHITTDGRVIGIFGYSPNYVALFLAPIAVLQIILTWQNLTNKRYWIGFFHFLSFFMSLLAIYFSGSRGGFLAVAAGVGVFILAQYWSFLRERLSSQIIVGILIIIALYTAWTFFRPNFSVSPESGGRIATSNNLRWEIWKTSIQLGKKHPLLGVGLGNFQNAFSEFTKNSPNYPEYISPLALTPHNIFLTFWLEAGILGLIAFVWLLVIFYRRASKNLSNQFNPMIIAVMSSIVLYGLVEASIWKNDLSMIFWVIWGLSWVI